MRKQKTTIHWKLKRMLSLSLAFVMLFGLFAFPADAEQAEPETEEAVLSATASNAAFPLPQQNNGTIETTLKDSEFAQGFSDPDYYYKPKIRWWWPAGAVDVAQIKKEIDEFVKQGFGGAEILSGSNLSGAPVWCSDEYFEAIGEALRYIDENYKGFKLDLSLTPTSKPTVISTITTANNDLVSQNLRQTSTNVSGGSTGNLTISAPNANTKLLTVRAYKRDTTTTFVNRGGGMMGAPPAPTYVYHEGSLDLTNVPGVVTVDGTNIRISWQNPNSESWLLIAVYQQPTGQLNLGLPAINHLNSDAVGEVIRFHEEKAMPLWAPYADSIGDIFIDSLEFTIGASGYQVTVPNLGALWSDDFANEFEARRGYDILGYLAYLFSPTCKSNYTDLIGGAFSEEAGFQTANGSAADGISNLIRNDYYQTVNELYVEGYLSPLQEWCDQYGWNVRAQNYGLPFDMTYANMSINVPETEGMYFTDVLDGYRLFTGTAHMGRQDILSNEIGVESSGNFAQRLLNPNGNSLINSISKSFAAGINQMVFHGFCYSGEYSGGANGFAPGVNWPGYEMFGATSYANNWNKQVQWVQMLDSTSFVARNQYVIRQGKPDVDVAFFRNTYYESQMYHPLFVSNLENYGYTYDFISPALMDLETAVVTQTENGPVLDADGPGYKALVINHDNFKSSTAHPDTSTRFLDLYLSVEAAERILEYAEAGLPIVFVGDLPKYNKFFSEGNVDITEIVSDILETGKGYVVSTERELPGLFAQLGITPEVSYDNQPIVNYHRIGNDHDYAYFYNQGAGTVNTEVTFESEGTPYFLDAWTGEITPVANYRTESGKTIVPISMIPRETLLIAIDKSSDAIGLNVVDGAASVAYDDAGNVYAKISKNGQYSFVFSNGAKASISVDNAPEPFELSDWTLNIESWGRPVDYQTTSRTRIAKVQLETITLNELKAWDEINSSLANTSGIGVYKTTFSLNHWDSGKGAVIHLGNVNDVFRIMVNGESVTGNQITTSAEIGDYLKQGQNEIVVTVATTFINYMRTPTTLIEPTSGLSGSRNAQKYGLMGINGAVVVTPYDKVLLVPVVTSFQEDLESKYIDPDRVYSTDVRWWLGETSHTDETLMEEIQAIYDAGFRGIELCMQSDDDNANNATYAWGSEMWAYRWKLLMNKILDLGMGLSLTAGTNWATTNVPSNYLGPDTVTGAFNGATGANSLDAMQSIGLVTTNVNAGASITTIAGNQNSRTHGQFVGAYAFRVVSGNVVDHESMIDLTSLATPGANWYTVNLNWTNTSSDQYRIFSYWMRGQNITSTPSASTNVAVNYHDKRGVAAVKRAWEAMILDDPVLNAKIKASGNVHLFLDSLEISDVVYWSEDFAAEFIARKGYDIRPYLFLATGATASVANPYNAVSLGTHTLSGQQTLNRQYVTDYLDVKNQLYQEYYLQELRDWLNPLGIAVRQQISYGRAYEISEPIMYVDFPEAEGLNQYNQVDIYRLWSGGAKLQNKVLSSETSTQFQMRPGFTHQYRLRDVYSLYAAGFQHIVWHVWIAQWGHRSQNYNTWPGYLPSATIMNYTNLDLLGTRFPAYRDYDELNAHVGRVSQLVQTGKARSDIGFIHNNWTQGVRYGGGVSSTNIQQTNWQLAHQGIYYRSTELQDNGYTYDYFSPRFLYQAPEVYFDAVTKTIEPAGYKAIVLYQPWLELEGAEKLLEWAKKGLKVVILDDAASYTISAGDDDAALKDVIDELKTLPTVREATTADPIPGGVFASAAGGYDNDVMQKLQELGVYPYAAFAEENHQLLTQSRVDDQGNMYLYAYNYCPNDFHDRSWRPSVRSMDHGTCISTEIKMDGIFIPYSIDAWSGNVTQLANYRYENGRTVFPISLDYDSIALFAFEAVADGQVHIVETNADSAFVRDDAIVIRALESGTYLSTMSSGMAYQHTLNVPAPYDIENWDLTVTSWTDGGLSPARTDTHTMPSGAVLTTTNHTRLTAKTDINVTLPVLTTWNNIPAVGDRVSGTGRYEATFNWDADAADGAYLDFGDKLFDGMKVWINGIKVGGDISTNPTKAPKSVGVAIDGVVPVGRDTYTGGVSWTKPLVDIGEYLQDGENDILIEYSSHLTNVLYTANTVRVAENWWGYNVYRYPLGPSQAVIVPYVEAEIAPGALTVSFNANGGAGVMGDVTAESGVPFVLPKNTYTRANHTFAAWNTVANGSGVSYLDEDTIIVTAPTILYALWTRDAIVVGPGPIIVPGW